MSTEKQIIIPYSEYLDLVEKSKLKSDLNIITADEVFTAIFKVAGINNLSHNQLYIELNKVLPHCDFILVKDDMFGEVRVTRKIKTNNGLR